MSVQEVFNALRHVHGNLDTDKQWQRARDGLTHMTKLKRAQVWISLSSHTLTMDSPTAPVILSQYKALYKAALKSLEENNDVCEARCECGNVPDGGGGNTMTPSKDILTTHTNALTTTNGSDIPQLKEVLTSIQANAKANEANATMLNRMERVLQEYQSFLSELDIRKNDDTSLVLHVQRVINESGLLSELKKNIRDILTESTIQATKANEASLTTISSTLEELKAKIEELASKLGNTNLGTLATEVNEASRKTAAMQESHAGLLDAMERIKDAMANHTIERVALKSTMDSLADMAKDISGQGKHMTAYMDKVYKHIQEQAGLAQVIGQMMDLCGPEIEKFEKIIEDVHHIREKLDMDGEGVEEEGAYEDEEFEAPDADPASPLAEHDTEPAIPQAAGSASEAHESEEEEAHVAAPPAEHGTGPAISQAARGRAKKPASTSPTSTIKHPLEGDPRRGKQGQKSRYIHQKQAQTATQTATRSARKAPSTSPPRHIEPWHSEFPHSEHSEFNLSPSGRASSPSAPGSP
jgi:hypothetical protein